MDFHVPFNTYEQQYKHKYLALYHALRDAMVQGMIPYGTRLPSSREMARTYEISRGIVHQVYEMLAAEGYLSASVGRGTYAAFRFQSQASLEQAQRVSLSDWGSRINDLPHRKHEAAQPAFNFRIGYPDMTHFPTEEWSRALFAAVREMNADQRTESFQSQGYYPLREAIGRHLRRTRGVEASADHIVIVNGSMQAIALIAHLLVNSGERVVLEEPCYIGTRNAVEAAGGIPEPAQVDSDGIVVREWDSRLLFVTPSRQFPTGAVLSLERRQALLQWAAEKGRLLVEDDYDSEFRYRGRPIEPLKALDREGRVIYVGTFSKTLLPDYRIGYAVLPSGLVDPFCKAQQLFEPHPTSLLEQRALASFMNSGTYERHLRKMKRVYSAKFACMLENMRKYILHLFQMEAGDAGLHIFARWKLSREVYQAYTEACRREGIVWTDPTSYYFGEPEPAACFGFSHASPEMMRAGMERMAAIWDEKFGKQIMEE